jgi:hypothetical protein
MPISNIRRIQLDRSICCAMEREMLPFLVAKLKLPSKSRL